MSTAYLDKIGLAHLWEKIKALFLSDKPIVNEDTEPYLLRNSGGSVEVGTKEYDKIVGGSIGWNQLIQNGNFSNGTTGWSVTRASTSVSDNICTTTCSSDNSTFYLVTHGSYLFRNLINRVCLIRLDVKSNVDNFLFRVSLDRSSINNNRVFNDTLGAADTWNSFAFIYKPIANVPVQIRTGTASPSAVGTNYSLRNVNVCDLTTMFGTDVAEYVYELETANEGAGVAWLKKYGFFTEDFYDYDPGSIKSVKDLVSHRMTGKNLLDVASTPSKTSHGVTFTVNQDGSIVVNGTASALVQFTPAYFHDVAGEDCYYFTSGLETTGSINTFDAYCWDSTVGARPKKWNGTDDVESSFDSTFKEVKLVKGHVIHMNIRVRSGVTVNNLVLRPMVCRKDITDTTFVPYVEHVYPLDSSVALNGLPKLNANNELSYDGDIWDASGKITRKYGVVDLGTLTWATGDSVDYWYAYINGKAPGRINMTCSKYAVKNVSSATELGDMQMCGHDAHNAVFVLDATHTSDTAADFKTAMSGIYVVYELGVTTIESSTPYAHLQDVSPDGLEEYVLSDDAFPMPVGHTTSYPINASYKIPTLPDLSPEGDGTYLIEQIGDEMKLTPKHDSASVLETARTIDGVSFDGSSNITRFGICDTSSFTANKTVTIGGTFSLNTGSMVTVKFSNTNEANSPTLNVNDTGSKPILYKGFPLPKPGCLRENCVYTFVYSGVNEYSIVGDLPGIPLDLSSYIGDFYNANFDVKEFDQEGCRITFNFKVKINNVMTNRDVQIADITDNNFYPDLNGISKISFPGLVVNDSGNGETPEGTCLMTIDNGGKIYLNTTAAGQNRYAIITGSYYCLG